MSDRLVACRSRMVLGGGSHASHPAAGGAEMGENWQVQVVFGLAYSLYKSDT